MHNSWIDEQPNEDFLFLINEDDESFDGNLHREILMCELFDFCHYFDLTKREIRQSYYRVLQRFALNYHLGKLDPSNKWHTEFYNDMVADMKSYKWEQIQERRKKIRG
jgi:hypothetical protein